MFPCGFDEESFGRSGGAVGLSALSFSAALQKDAASIPNAEVLREPCRSLYIN